MPIEAKALVPSIYELLTQPWTSGIATAAEVQAGVVVYNYAYPELNILRYYSGSGSYATAINNALAAAAQYSPIRAVVVPPGRYDTSNGSGTAIPLLLKDGATLIGAGGINSCTQIGLQGTTAGNVIQNANGSTFNNVTIKGIAFYGGAYGIHAVTPAGQQQLLLEDVAFVLQTTAAIFCSNTWQINIFLAVVFNATNNGIVISAGDANGNLWVGGQMINMDGTCISYGGTAQINKFVGLDIEKVAHASTNNPLTPVVLVTGTNDGMHFDGCYFENCHKTLLSEGASLGGTRYDNCHFTGGAVEGADSPDQNGFKWFIFTSNAEVQFGTNSWFIKSAGPTWLRNLGNNQNLLGTGRGQIQENGKSHQRFTSASTVLTPVAQTVTVVSLLRTLTDGTINDLQMLHGKLRINYFRTTGGGVTDTYAAEVGVSVVGIAGAAIGVTYGTPVITVNSGTETFTYGTSGLSSTGGNLTVAVAAMPAGAVCVLQWSFEADSGANTSTTYEPIIASHP